MEPERNIKRILITGLTGTGGSQLAEYIVNNHPEVEVHGISRSYGTLPSENIKGIADKVVLHRCDMNDFSSILKILKIVKPDGIFHLASYAEVKGSFDMPLFVTYNNIMSSANLFEAVRQAEIDPYILITSTPEVYGQIPQEQMPITENHQTNPVNPYAASKLYQEKLAYIYFKSYGMKNIVTRMFSYINPRRKDLFSTSFAMQVARIEEGLQKELLHGNLKSTRTLIDVRDSVDAYWTALNKCRTGEIYNISGKTVKTVGEFLDLLKSLAKTEIPSRLDPKLLRITDSVLQVVDTSKFEKETGWKPKYSFEETIQYLLDYCRNEAKKYRI